MDPIANMFSQLKNAGSAGKKETIVSYSKLNLAILKILKNRGFIADFKEEKKENQKYPYQIWVTLKFKNRYSPSFSNIKRVSRPGRRIYLSADKISKAAHGKMEILLSTSSGVMTGVEARRKGIGGELICEVM